MEAHQADRGGIIVLEETRSTNEELAALARSGGAGHGTAVRAVAQTAGRGRRAHGWASPAGGLYLSIAISPRVDADQLPGLPVACGLGVIAALDGAGARGARLKWPNDIVAGRGKLGGILVELVQAAAGPIAVCGIGINMSAPSHPQLEPGALAPVGLDALSPVGEPVDAEGLAPLVRDAVLESCARWADGLGPGDAPLSSIVQDYNDVLAFRGDSVRVAPVDGDAYDEGVLIGVDALGRAIIDRPGGPLAIDASLASIRPRE